LILTFVVIPSPTQGHGADDCLAAGLDNLAITIAQRAHQPPFAGQGGKLADNLAARQAGSLGQLGYCLLRVVSAQQRCEHGRARIGSRCQLDHSRLLCGLQGRLGVVGDHTKYRPCGGWLQAGEFKYQWIGMA
jgi:hypothetical protein